MVEAQRLLGPRWKAVEAVARVIEADLVVDGATVARLVERCSSRNGYA
jgi:hypothetical protein